MLKIDNENSILRILLTNCFLFALYLKILSESKVNKCRLW